MNKINLKFPLSLIFSTLLALALVLPLSFRLSEFRKSSSPDSLPLVDTSDFEKLAPGVEIHGVSSSGEKMAGVLEAESARKPVVIDSGGLQAVADESFNVRGRVASDGAVNRIAFFNSEKEEDLELIVWEAGFGSQAVPKTRFEGEWGIEFSESGRDLRIWKTSSEASLTGGELGRAGDSLAYKISLSRGSQRGQHESRVPDRDWQLNFEVTPLSAKIEQHSSANKELRQSFAWHSQFKKNGNKSQSRLVGQDLDGDGVADFLLFGAGEKSPYWQAFLLGGFDGAALKTAGKKGKRGTWRFGINSGVPLTGDFDGDGLLDFATYLPQHGVQSEGEDTNWTLNFSSGKSISGQPQWLTSKKVLFGFGDMLAVVGDFDGDRISDIGTYQKNTGDWRILYASGRFNLFKGGRGDDGFGRAVKFSPGGVPVVGDYNGDGFDDLAVYRVSENGDGVWDLMFLGRDKPKGHRSIQFGKKGDVPVLGDFNCNGKTDVVVFRESSFEWIFRFGSENIKTFRWKPKSLGSQKLYPVTADYDGDGCSDPGYFIPGDNLPGQWLVFPSGFSEKSIEDTAPAGHNVILKKSFGRAEDLPVQVLTGFHHGRIAR